jgi:hypothetical protein
VEKHFTIHSGALAFIKSQTSLNELARKKPRYIPSVTRGHSGIPGKISDLCLKGKCSNCYVANCPHECHKME